MGDEILGCIDGDSVVIRDQAQASQIYNKGYFGTPQSGGALRLDLLEAMYLLDTGRITMEKAGTPLDFEGLLGHALKRVPEIEVKYAVFHDMRQRGYVVRQGPASVDFSILPRGGAPTKDQARFWLAAVSERSRFSFEGLEETVDLASSARKQLLMGVVDEEGDVTYYAVDTWNPKGKEQKEPPGHARATFLCDRSVVFEPGEVSGLQQSGNYGKVRGSSLQLSLLETAYLMAQSGLELRDGRTKRAVSLDALKKKARRSQQHFDARLRVYEDLKDRGLIVKTGFKYGVHFRVYDGDPEHVHARFLVHAMPEGVEGTWPDVSRAVRLAQGVKKELALARTDDEAIRYLMLRRTRP